MMNSQTTNFVLALALLQLVYTVGLDFIFTLVLLGGGGGGLDALYVVGWMLVSQNVKEVCPGGGKGRFCLRVPLIEAQES